MIVVVITTAVVVATALFQAAVWQGHAASQAAFNAQSAQQLVSIFGEQRIIMFRYMARRTPASLAAVQALDRRFRGIAGAIQPSNTADEAMLAAAVTAQAGYYASFQASIPPAHLQPNAAVRGHRDPGTKAPPVTAQLTALANSESR